MGNSFASVFSDTDFIISVNLIFAVFALFFLDIGNSSENESYNSLIFCDFMEVCGVAVAYEIMETLVFYNIVDNEVSHAVLAFFEQISL